MTGIFAKKVEFLLMLCVIATLWISGCIGPTDGMGGGPGLVVEKFEIPPPTTIDSGEQIGLHLEVRNQGGYNGELGTGAPAIVELMQIDPMEWAVTPSTVIDLGSILAPIPETGTQGELAKADWQLIAPLLERGQTQSFRIDARVYYAYETKARKPVQFVTSDELRRMIQTGESLASDPAILTAGPLTVMVDAGQMVKAKDWTNARFPLQIRISNTGGGRIAGKDYPIAIEVTYPQWVMPVEGYCPAQSLLGAPIYNDVPPGLPQPIGNFIYMWDGMATDVTCEFEIIQPPASKTKGNFEVTLKYIYSIDTTTQVTVRGIEQF